jgi:hypothetical protein
MPLRLGLANRRWTELKPALRTQIQAHPAFLAFCNLPPVHVYWAVAHYVDTKRLAAGKLRLCFSMGSKLNFPASEF